MQIIILTLIIHLGRSHTYIMLVWPGFCSQSGQKSLLYALSLLGLSCCKKIIRIHHEYKDGIEKFVPRITDWHHEACGVMVNGSCKGWIFLFHPHTISCSPLNTLFYIGKNEKGFHLTLYTLKYHIHVTW